MTAKKKKYRKQKLSCSYCSFGNTASVTPPLVSRDSTEMAGAPGTNISRPRAKSAIQKTIMADETTSSVSKVSCLENDRKFALVSLLYS